MPERSREAKPDRPLTAPEVDRTRRARRAFLQRASAAALTPLLVAVVGAGSCASPTAIRVDIYTELDCAIDAEVSLTVSSDLAGLPERAPSATSRGCVSPGRVGDVVIAPAEGDDKQLAYAVATRQDVAPVEECLQTPMPADCIVSRRQLRYSPNDELKMRIDLRLSCLGVACPAEQTCVKGRCIDAEVSPEQCMQECGEDTLEEGPGGDGPDPDGGTTEIEVIDAELIARLASDALSVPRFAPLTDGFAAAWISPDMANQAVRVQKIDAQTGPVGAPSPPLSSRPTIARHLLGYDGVNLGLLVADDVLYFHILDTQGSEIAAGMGQEPATLAGHDMPWSGNRYAVLAQIAQYIPSHSVMLHALDGQNTAAEYAHFCQDCAPMAVAWNGARFGITWHKESQGSFISVSEAANGTAPVVVCDACEGGHVAALPGAFGFAYQVGTPARIYYAQLDEAGNVVAGPHPVSPDDGQAYRHARTITTASGVRLVFFSRPSGTVSPLFVARVGADAQVVTPVARIEGVFVADDQYEVSVHEERVAVGWRGREDAPDPSAPPDGAHIALVSASAVP
ncbi:hypothetical protein [Chondromyces apiculatus]|uniref:Uncharacterized protein n=1 Tax=Chondromyces apiculatus DSM 436 TaxID=1192034 RepID=A0A017TJI6_9BACT|nr:hypothetical protein [Chondromyces apiculatus]EYF08806.1 Hypothetical protein CAP_2667 [Chondromyces apiculatus DSM 436]